MFTCVLFPIYTEYDELSVMDKVLMRFICLATKRYIIILKLSLHSLKRFVTAVSL